MEKEGLSTGRFLNTDVIPSGCEETAHVAGDYCWRMSEVGECNIFDSEQEDDICYSDGIKYCCAKHQVTGETVKYVR
jgi:hypothetical protein